MAGLEAAVKSSSYVEYLFASLNDSSIDDYSLREIELRNCDSSPTACLTACITKSILTASSWWIIPLKRFIKSRRDSPLSIMVLNMSAMLRFYLTKHRYLVVKDSDGS